MDRERHDILSDKALLAIKQKACEQPVPEAHIHGIEADGKPFCYIYVLN
jgi:hypothetical protein